MFFRTRPNPALLALAVCLGAALTGCSAASSSCPAGLTKCNGECVNLLTDNRYCSNTTACGTACDAGEICNGAGVCTLSCQSELTECNSECVNLLTDNRYCSATTACGTACDAGEICNGAGVCALSCQSGLTECNSECVNLLTDNRYCSATTACGTSCDAGEICNGAGVCALSCQSGLTECNSECVNLLTDNRYCSTTDSCGTACESGEVCNGAGVCALSCQSELTECNSECVNLLTDNRYCSATTACGTACDAGEICNGAGVCALSCQADLTECSGQCVDTDNDPANCGGCDDGLGSNTCTAGTQACVAGQCADLLLYRLPTAATDVSLGVTSALVSGNRVYVVAGTLFKVIDVTNPLSPSELGSVAHGFSDLRVEPQVVSGNIVWCVRSSSGGYGSATYVSAIDVSDPSAPVVRGSLQLQTGTSLLSNTGSVIYQGFWLVHDYSDNLIYILDISNPDAPAKYDEWSVPNMVDVGPGPMMVDGSLLYFPTRPDGPLGATLTIYNLADLTNVVQVGQVALSGDPSGPPVKIGSYIYLTDAGGLRAIDVSDPTAPFIAGTVAVSSSSYVKSKNGKLFLLSDTGPTVSAYSLANPIAPVLEASTTIPLPAPSSSLSIMPMAYSPSTWVGNYLVGMTNGSASAYSGARALDFTVN